MQIAQAVIKLEAGLYSAGLDRLAITASAEIASGAYTEGRLIPHQKIVRDGFIDLDFMAAAPGGEGTEPSSRLQALLQMPLPKEVVGVRVHSMTNMQTLLIRDLPQYPDVKTWDEKCGDRSGRCSDVASN